MRKSCGRCQHWARLVFKCNGEKEGLCEKYDLRCPSDYCCKDGWKAIPYKRKPNCIEGE